MCLYVAADYQLGRSDARDIIEVQLTVITEQRIRWLTPPP
jgi:hypothetical protein